MDGAGIEAKRASTKSAKPALQHFKSVVRAGWTQGGKDLTGFGNP